MVSSEALVVFLHHNYPEPHKKQKRIVHCEVSHFIPAEKDCYHFAGERYFVQNVQNFVTPREGSSLLQDVAVILNQDASSGVVTVEEMMPDGCGAASFDRLVLVEISYSRKL